MRRVRFCLYAVFLVLPLLMGSDAGCGGGNSLTAEEQALHDTLSRYVREMNIPGAVAAVRNPDGSVVTMAAGVGRDTTLSSATPSRSLLAALSPAPAWAASWSGPGAGTAMHSRIGSVTKTFTAALFLLLQEDGLLDLDDTLATHLGAGYYPNATAVTLRQLLNMTAGYQNYTELDSFAERYLADPAAPIPPEDLVDMARTSATPVIFAPGTDWSYSNTNYVILGLVAEAVTGATFQQLVRDRILTPLGRNATFCPDTANNTLPAPRLSGYADLGQGMQDVTNATPSIAFSAGNMISTAGELAFWIRELVDGNLLSAASRVQMRDFVSREDGGAWNGTEAGYGLGLAYSKGAVGHEGEITGYQACCYRYRERSFSMLINAAPERGGVDDLFWDVVLLYYPDALE